MEANDIHFRNSRMVDAIKERLDAAGIEYVLIQDCFQFKSEDVQRARKVIADIVILDRVLGNKSC